jgi:hypothetical protein
LIPADRSPRRRIDAISGFAVDLGTHVCLLQLS